MGFTSFRYSTCYPLSDIFYLGNFLNDHLKSFSLVIAGFSCYRNELRKNDCSTRIPFELLIELELWS
jgi:hypothetical protein